MRFRRKAGNAEETPDAGLAHDADAAEAAEPAPPQGPFDVADVAGDEVERVDLGSLLITPIPGLELRLQVAEATQTVQAVLLAGPDGAVELAAFAAPRNGDLWSQARQHIAADTARQGGTASEREGRFGIELMCSRPVRDAAGKGGLQPSRVVGVNGPRWFLRATFLGRPAREPEQATEWEDTLATVVVNRGTQAMPPGDALPLSFPPQARPQSPVA